MGVKSIAGGTVVTMDPDRRTIEDGVVVIEDHHISAVGPASEVRPPRGSQIIDASGMAVLPGLINCHTHVPQILLRGYVANEGRRVWDWLTNVVHPGLAAYELSDIRTAARLYCVEAIRSGMTCFVDNEDAWPDNTLKALGQAIDSYSEAGVRAMVARMMFDEQPDQVRELIRSLQEKEPQVVHTDNWRPTVPVAGPRAPHQGLQRIIGGPDPDMALACRGHLLRAHAESQPADGPRQQHDVDPSSRAGSRRS